MSRPGQRGAGSESGGTVQLGTTNCTPCRDTAAPAAGGAPAGFHSAGKLLLGSAGLARGVPAGRVLDWSWLSPDVRHFQQC